MSTYDIQPIYAIRDALICLVCLACMGGAFVFFSRRQYLVAGLVVAGFGLLGLEPIADFVVWQLAWSADIPAETIDWLYIIISSVGLIGGMVVLLAALILSTRQQADERGTSPFE